MSTYCEYTGDQLKESLHDRFICGLRSESIQKKLLAKTYSFERAVEIVTAEEAAAKDIREMSQHASPQIHTMKQTPPPRRGAYRGRPRTPNQSQPRQQCDRCGLKNHTRDKCWHKDKECLNCGKTGHLKSQCRSKKETERSNPNRTNYVQEDESTNATDLDTAVFRVSKETPRSLGDKPIIVPVVIEGVALEMELDTGAAVSIVSCVDYLKYFCHIPLSTTTRQLHVYSGSPLGVAGEITVKVKYNTQECQLPMLVVKADKQAPPLFGRSWLRVIKLDWPSIFSQGTHVVKLDMMKELQRKYADIFNPELGTVKGAKATLHLRKDVKPVFCKARSVPFALRPAVERELERMQSEGIIMLVSGQLH